MWDNIIGVALVVGTIAFIGLVSYIAGHSDEYRGFDHFNDRVKSVRRKKFKERRPDCFWGCWEGEISCKYCFNRDECWKECEKKVKDAIDEEVERRKHDIDSRRV